MKQIKLTQGKYALVDDEDFEKVNQFKWQAGFDKKRNCYTARRSHYIDNKIKTIYMHQYIMGTVGKGLNFSVDHVDHDTLNNQKNNLRVCTHGENQRNNQIHKNNTTGYKGVTSRKNKYEAKIRVNNKQIHIGCFYTAIEAAKAYNAKALELHGKFAKLNIIEAINE